MRQTDVEVVREILSIVRAICETDPPHDALREHGDRLVAAALRERPAFLDTLAREAIAAGFDLDVDALAAIIDEFSREFGSVRIVH